MIDWREKFIAVAIHFVATLTVALAAGAIIFLVWFPDPFQTMVGGVRLFLLVTGCDLALGPLISFVIYNSKKSRRALIFDYSIVALVQLAALVYGTYSVAQARPAFVVFSKDRLEVVTAGNLAAADLAEASDPRYRKPSILGPRLVATVVKQSDQNDAIFKALAGKDVSLRPKFYVEYALQREEIRRRAKPLAELHQKHPEASAMIRDSLADTKHDEARTLWLPVQHKEGFWTALIDADSATPLTYIPVDPY